MLNYSKIYLVDDDPIYVLTACQIIKKSLDCKEILVYQNGKDAFDALYQNRTKMEDLPDLIFLDINMPIWDGWDFLNELNKIELEKEVNIYVVSSSTHPEDILKAKSYQQVSDFIVKPLSGNQLMSLIN
jgi:CheY-like chemotaxis protein